MHKEIFKAYDIRGIYPSEIDEDAVYRIGIATVKELGATVLAVGRDARPHGASLMSHLIKGITDAGCDVIDLGMITTPMLYFASWHLTVDGAIAVTASHNPVEYNGIKICRKNAAPVGSASGLNAIRDNALAMTNDKNPLSTKGTVSPYDIKTPYYAYVADFAHLGKKKFHVVIDCANTMGVLELPIYEKFPHNITITKLYCDLDHPYTAHEANPLNTSTLDDVREKVLEVGASLGIAYDGDADRIGFIDEHGDIISMDLVTGLLAKVLLANNPHATILYDLRSSMAVKEVIEETGGIAHECRVGHAFIKAQMREEDALFAGELSGHYYFKANKNGELTTFAALTIMNLMAQSNKNISALVADLRRYYHSGEINTEVKDLATTLTRLKETYCDGSLTELDGIKISYWDAPRGARWWFNVRASNTEPVLRLNLEADTQKLMEKKRDEILALIRNTQ